jgi:hypothetical protein
MFPWIPTAPTLPTWLWVVGGIVIGVIIIISRIGTKDTGPQASPLTSILSQATRAAENASKATNVYQQLLFAQWGIAMINAAQIVEPDEERLIERTKINVPELQRYLDNAQSLAMKKLQGE